MTITEYLDNWHAGLRRAMEWSSALSNPTYHYRKRQPLTNEEVAQVCAMRFRKEIIALPRVRVCPPSQPASPCALAHEVL